MFVNGEWLNEFRIEKYRSTKAKVTTFNQDLTESKSGASPWLIVYLKKQTQFEKGQNDVILVITMVYEDLGGRMQRKNKANCWPLAGNPKQTE